MCVDEARQQGTAAQLHHLSARAAVGERVGVGTHGEDPAAAHRERGDDVVGGD